MPLKVVPLSSKSPNCNVWSGEQCVQAFLDDIKAGTIAPAKLMILWFSENPDGSLKPNRWFAQMNSCEEIALLEMAKQIGLEEWKK